MSTAAVPLNPDHAACDAPPEGRDGSHAMDPKQRYFEQIFPSPPVICGRTLKPLSLGRYRMMARFNCAWTADESRTATAGDLLIGLIICSMRCDQFELLAAQSDFRKQIQIYGELNGFFKPSWRTLLKHPLFFLCNLARLFNPSLYDALDAREIVQAMRAFQEYIEDETVVPDYWDETENNRVTAMHWSQSMGLVLCGQLNWTDEMINEKSLGRALWDYFGHMESQGLITLMTKEEIEDYHHQKNLTAEEITQQTNALAVLMAHQKEIHGE